MGTNQLNGMPIIYNIGYQFMSIGKMRETISENDITVLVDVRSVPFSGIDKAFNRPELKKVIPCRYEWWGDRIGGRGISERQWEENLVIIAKMAESENILIMCMESNYDKCHRRQLSEIIARVHRIHCINL